MIIKLYKVYKPFRRDSFDIGCPYVTNTANIPI